MKTTRILLAFAAALSLGLAVFANIHANTSTQSTVKGSDELATEPSGADATGIQVALWPDCNGETNKADAAGVQVALWPDCNGETDKAAAAGVQVALWPDCNGETNKAAAAGVQVASLQDRAGQTKQISKV